MTNWPQFNITTTDHTVNTPGGLVAGLLVRCTRSRKDLGYIWSTANEWNWRTASGRAFGTRATLRTAVETLRDIADLPLRQPSLFFDSTPEPVATRPYRAPQPAPTPIPKPAPVRHVEWTDQTGPDLTAAIRAALTRHQEPRS